MGGGGYPRRPEVCAVEKRMPESIRVLCYGQGLQVVLIVKREKHIG